MRTLSGEEETTQLAGVGSWREKWITYRDAQNLSEYCASRSTLSLEFLMLHGLIYARQAEHLDSDPGSDFQNEVHSYFGSGTQLQELYVSHSLLSKNDWDLLAEAAILVTTHAEVLRTHMVGGDPGKLKIYGWAAWSPAKPYLRSAIRATRVKHLDRRWPGL